MKAINALIVSAMALGLGACAISVEGDGPHYASHQDRMTVTLPSGERDSFSCPKGTDAFVVDKTADGKGMVYGCRTQGAALPVLQP